MSQLPQTRLLARLAFLRLAYPRFAYFGLANFGLTVLCFFLAGAICSQAQSSPYERTFHQSKAAVEKALKELQPAMSGHLPVLDGFATAGEHPLSRYQRAFYQTSAQVNTNASGGVLVRVSAKVTAWYADTTGSHSGYQLLTSNGRLESDFLDQLSEALATSPNANGIEAENSKFNGTANSKNSGDLRSNSDATAKTSSPYKVSSERDVSVPTPRPADNGAFTTQRGLSAQELADSKNAQKTANQPAGLQAEAASLEEVLKNQAHPKNLVAIKKSGTPVVSSPSLTAKTLFLASAHDEFEMLDFSTDWVHVRISGLSRGWIWRTSLEMPEGISDIPQTAANGEPVAADLFQVTREESALFPGDWAPLRGKSVKIISVQKIQEGEANSGAQAKLEYAKSLMDKNYLELAKSRELAGIVLIFDSIDGGMIAATIPTVQAWKAGKLSDAALWHQCYFDPPETFTVSTAAAGIEEH